MPLFSISDPQSTHWPRNKSKMSLIRGVDDEVLLATIFIGGFVVYVIYQCFKQRFRSSERAGDDARDTQNVDESTNASSNNRSYSGKQRIRELKHRFVNRNHWNRELGIWQIQYDIRVLLERQAKSTWQFNNYLWNKAIWTIWLVLYSFLLFPES